MRAHAGAGVEILGRHEPGPHLDALEMGAERAGKGFVIDLDDQLEIQAKAAWIHVGRAHLSVVLVDQKQLAVSEGRRPAVVASP